MIAFKRVSLTERADHHDALTGCFSRISGAAAAAAASTVRAPPAYLRTFMANENLADMAIKAGMMEVWGKVKGENDQEEQ